MATLNFDLHTPVRKLRYTKDGAPHEIDLAGVGGLGLEFDFFHPKAPLVFGTLRAAGCDAPGKQLVIDAKSGQLRVRDHGGAVTPAFLAGDDK